ncbi:MAG: hypothetical protein U0P45_14980 [Acidimicrobiales bacterium]
MKADPMFLYELAIEQGIKSADLVDAARALGMGDLTAADTLDGNQVVALRNHLALNPIAPVAPGSAPPPLPAPQTGPLVAAPPPAAGTAQPVAPASWGPPTGQPTAPPSWGPPTPGPQGAPTGPPPGAPTGAPAFAPPIAFVPGGPGPGAGPGPGPGVPGLPAAPPTFDGPPTLAGPVPPPPPIPPGAPPGAYALAGPGGPGGPGAPVPAPGPGGLTRQQIVLIAVVVAVVVGLFAFMVINTGPDKAKQEALKAQDEKAEKTLSTYVPPTVPSTTTTTEAPTTTGPSRFEPRDETAFCDGFRGVNIFELRLMAAMMEKDFAKLKSITDTERPAWEAAVKQLAGGAAPRLDDTIRLYVDTYHVMLDGIDATDSWPAFSQKVDLTQLQDLPGKVTSLNIEARTRCL